MARRERDDRGGKRRSRRGSGGSIRRLLGMLALLPVASRAPLYARLIWSLVLDERTPASRKAVLAGAVGYVALGRDVVPDDLPLLGGIDDLVVVALALDVFIDGVDDDVLDEKLDELRIDRAAFDDDVNRLRRLLPGPIRRTVRRLPGLVAATGDALQQTGIGPRLRAWITSDREPVAKEGSIA